MIFVIDDDEIMAECIAGYCKGKARIFSNAIQAIQALDEKELPNLIFLDVLLDGPDGFTFLNELVSFPDTAKIPVVIITSLNMSGVDLADYGVVGVLEKEKMRPEDVREFCQKYDR